MLDDVPKIIFQTWKTKNVPHAWQEAQASVQKKNPGFKYVFLTDADNEAIVRDYFPSFLQTYQGLAYGIQRADTIRYILLYLYGGIYLDLDYVAIKAFDKIKLDPGKQVGLISSSNASKVLTNSFLISKPSAPFWLECLEEIKQAKPIWAITKHIEVMSTTGPLMINRVAARNMEIVQVLDKIAVPCTVCNIDHCKYDSTYYIMPIRGQTWNSMDSYIINWFMCNYNHLILFILLVALCVVFLYRIESNRNV